MNFKAKAEEILLEVEKCLFCKEDEENDPCNCSELIEQALKEAYEEGVGDKNKLLVDGMLRSNDMAYEQGKEETLGKVLEIVKRIDCDQCACEFGGKLANNYINYLDIAEAIKDEFKTKE